MRHRTVVLLSAGLDSPVAAYLMGESGAEVALLHLDNRPFTDDETVRAVEDLIYRLKEMDPSIIAYKTDFSNVQKSIAKNTNQRFQCILCRRMMYRVAEKLAKRIDADSISTGESLGQVASQTLSNLSSEDDSVEIEILRPLIGLDKKEIVDIAKEIATYEISTRPAVCCLLTPKGPKVSSTKKEVAMEENKIDVNGLLGSLKFEKMEVA